jgi:hypothetical protein
MAAAQIAQHGSSWRSTLALGIVFLMTVKPD